MSTAVRDVCDPATNKPVALILVTLRAVAPLTLNKCDQLRGYYN